MLGADIVCSCNNHLRCMSIYTLDKNVLSRLSERSIGDLSLWGWKKSIGSCGIRMNVAISVFPHSSSLSVSITHSAIRLTSALCNFSILCTPALIPTLPRIQHNQCFIWPWLKPPLFFTTPPRKGLSGYSQWSSPHQPFLSELRLFHRQSASLCEYSAEEREPPN